MSAEIERAEQLAAEIDERLAELVQIVRDIKNAPKEGRWHWVFLNPCGCAYGVMDAPADATGSGAQRAAAWAEFYEDAVPAGFAMMARGATLVLAGHEHYDEHYEQQLRDGCPHQGGAG